MLAADTLASYGSLAMFKDVTRIARTGSYTLVGASGELSAGEAITEAADEAGRGAQPGGVLARVHKLGESRVPTVPLTVFSDGFI